MLVGGMLMAIEDSFIYYPTRFPEGQWDAATSGPCQATDVFMTAADGVTIHGWYFKSAHASTKRTLLFFHGNAGNLSDRYSWSCSLTALPANILIVDYRGYGKSEGEPGEAGVYLDAEAAYRWLREDQELLPENIVVYGKSLGGGAACEVALRHPVAGLILQSTFTGIGDMAQKMFPFLPARWLVKSKFDNLGKVSRISAPKLIIHSRADDLIPYSMAERLYQNAESPKSLLSFDNAGHNDLIWREGDAIILGMQAFLERIEAAAQTEPEGS